MKKKSEVFQPSGDAARVQRLGLGWTQEGKDRYVRIFDHLGKSHHVSVEQNTEYVRTLIANIFNENPDIAKRIVSELEAAGVTGFSDALEVADS